MRTGRSFCRASGWSNCEYMCVCVCVISSDPWAATVNDWDALIRSAARDSITLCNNVSVYFVHVFVMQWRMCGVATGSVYKHFSFFAAAIIYVNTCKSFQIVMLCINHLYAHILWMLLCLYWRMVNMISSLGSRPHLHTACRELKINHILFMHACIHVNELLLCFMCFITVMHLGVRRANIYKQTGRI